MKKALRVLIDALYLLLGKYGAYLVTLVTLPFTSRMLGVDQFGLLNLGMAAYFVGSILVDFGLSQFLAAEQGRGCLSLHKRRMYTCVRWSVFMAIVLGATVGAIVGSDVTLSLLLGAVAGGASSLNEMYLLIGESKFSSIMWSQIAGRVLYLGLLIATLPSYPSSATALVCLTVSSLGSNAIVWLLARNVVTSGPIRTGEFSEMLRDGSRTSFGRLLSSLTGQGASALYAFSVPAAMIGLYGAGDKLVRAGQSIFDALGLSLLPRFGRLSEGEDQFWRAVARVLLVTMGFSLIATIVFILTAPFVIPFVFGAAFEGATQYAQVLALMLPAVALSTVCVNIVLYVRKSAGGILLFSIVGALVTAIGVGISIFTNSAWTMVLTAVSAEWAVLITVLSIVLKSRRATVGRSPGVSLMGGAASCRDL